MIIWNTVPEIRHMTDVIVILHFGLFFCPLPPPQMDRQKKQHIEVGTPPKQK